MSDSEEGDILFLQLAVMLKTKKKNERKRKYWVPDFFFANKMKREHSTIEQEMKLADWESRFSYRLIILIDLFRISNALNICWDKIAVIYKSKFAKHNQFTI